MYLDICFGKDRLKLLFCALFSTYHLYFLVGLVVPVRKEGKRACKENPLKSSTTLKNVQEKTTPQSSRLEKSLVEEKRYDGSHPESENPIGPSHVEDESHIESVTSESENQIEPIVQHPEKQFVSELKIEIVDDNKPVEDQPSRAGNKVNLNSRFSTNQNLQSSEDSANMEYSQYYPNLQEDSLQASNFMQYSQYYPNLQENTLHLTTNM